MKATTLSTIAASLLLGLSSASAEPVTVYPDEVELYGDCTDVEIIDNEDLSLDFVFNDELLAEADGDTPRHSQMCIIRMPVTIAPRVRCAVSRVSFEGIADLENGGEAYAVLRHRFAGTSGSASIESFDDNGTVQDVVIEKAFEFAPRHSCRREPTEDTFKTTIQVVAKHPDGEDGFSTIAIEEGAQSIRYRLMCRPCSPYED